MTINIHPFKRRTTRCFMQQWCTTATCMLVLSLYPYSISAQFININIDIPPKTGLMNSESFEQDPDNTFIINAENDGKYVALGISCAENLLILATLYSPDSLHNEQDVSIKLFSALSYRNDGKAFLPKDFNGNRVFFPMSNSNRLIENMEDAPQSINAYLFIKTETSLVPNSASLFTGDIKLTIEYN